MYSIVPHIWKFQHQWSDCATLRNIISEIKLDSNSAPLSMINIMEKMKGKRN